jgi:hypothetical protein
MKKRKIKKRTKKRKLKLLKASEVWADARTKQAQIKAGFKL